MYYHASQVPGLQVLTPHLSSHSTPLVYFSRKRENVLVYLCNAIEKHCQEIGFDYRGIYKKWGSYGFNCEGLLQLDEYYPHATADTYSGVSGYIYKVEHLERCQELTDIPYAVISKEPVAVDACEFVPDAYEALLAAARKGELVLTRYEDNSPKKLDWIQKNIVNEYEQSADHPEYRLFLKAKFDFLSVKGNG